MFTPVKVGAEVERLGLDEGLHGEKAYDEKFYKSGIIYKHICSFFSLYLLTGVSYPVKRYNAFKDLSDNYFLVKSHSISTSQSARIAIGAG